MEKYYLFIAGYVIEITFIDAETESAKAWYLLNFKKLYKWFFYNGKVKRIDFKITVRWDEKQQIIRRENDYTSFVQYARKIDESHIETYYQNSLYQFQNILRDGLQSLLARGDGFIFHSSGVLINNKAFLFMGESGAGKSTAARLLSSKYEIIADDAIIIKKEGNRYYCFQTPFFEKNWKLKKRKKRYHLGSILFLHKAPYFNITFIPDSDEKFRLLLQHMYTTKNDYIRQTRNLLILVDKFHSIYNLRFAKKDKEMIDYITNYKYE